MIHYYAIPALKYREPIPYYKCYLDIHPEHILEVVSEFYSVSVDDIKKGNGRGTNSVVRPRQVAIYLYRLLTCMEWQQVGDIMGGYDHSSIISAHRRIKNYLNTEPSIAAQVEVLTQRLK